MQNNLRLLKPTESGTLESAYKGTLETLDNLMQLLNDLESQGLLPKEGQIGDRVTQTLLSGLFCVNLAKLHYPKMKFGTQRH